MATKSPDRQAHAVLYKSNQAFITAMNHYDDVIARWEVEPEAHYVNTRYGYTHLLVTGPQDAPPLMLFHGWGGNASGHGIDPGFAPLFKQFRTYMPDVIGQSGKSAPTRLPTSGGKYGEWIADVMDALGIERAYATGISGGGFMTLQTASAVPDRIIRAVVVSTAGVAPLLFSRSFKMIFKVVPLLLFPGERTAAGFIRMLVPPTIELTPLHMSMAEDVRFMMATLKKTAVNIVPLTDEELKRIKVPTRIVMGQHESTTDPQAVIRRAQALIKDVQTEIIPGVGHIMSFDAPKVVTERILSFFAMAQ